MSALANVRASISRHQGVQSGTLASQPPGVVPLGFRRIKKRLTTAENAAVRLKKRFKIEIDHALRPFVSVGWLGLQIGQN